MKLINFLFLSIILFSCSSNNEVVTKKPEPGLFSKDASKGINIMEFLNELWANRDEMPEDVVHSEIYNLGDSLIQGLDIPIAVQPLNEEQSAFFKTVYQNPARSSDQQFVIDKE